MVMTKMVHKRQIVYSLVIFYLQCGVGASSNHENGFSQPRTLESCIPGQVLNITHVSSVVRCKNEIAENSYIVVTAKIFVENRSSSAFYTPVVTTSAILSEEANAPTDAAILDTAAYPDNGDPIIWSQGIHPNVTTKIIYVKDSNLSKNTSHQTLRLILSNKIPEKIQFSLEIQLKCDLK